MKKEFQCAVELSLNFAGSLLDQQLWCWGRDIVRPGGNWLLEIGCQRIAPPAEREDCPSLYKLDLPHGRQLVLRGFGAFYGDRQRGGIFLPRNKFEPRYTPTAPVDCPPWSNQDLPTLTKPTKSQRSHFVMLTLELIDWIRDYEVNVLECLGIEYRRATLTKWDNGRRAVIPAEQMAPAWRQLSQAISSGGIRIGERVGPLTKQGHT